MRARFRLLFRIPDSLQLCALASLRETITAPRRPRQVDRQKPLNTTSHRRVEPRVMNTKSLATLLFAVIAAFALIPATQADAAPCARIVGYHSCGAPIYLVPVFCGYDRCGNPVYHYRREVRGCRCGSKHDYHHSRHRHSYTRPHIQTHRIPSYGGCSSSRSSYYRGRSGFSISFGR